MKRKCEQCDSKCKVEIVEIDRDSKYKLGEPDGCLYEGVYTPKWEEDETTKIEVLLYEAINALNALRDSGYDPDIMDDNVHAYLENYKKDIKYFMED